jgi:hypothetical protein
MRRTPDAARVVLLGLAMVATIALWTWWRFRNPGGCFPMTRPGGQPGSPVNESVLLADIPPLILFLAGLWIALGAGASRWRVVGMAVTAVAALVMLWIGLATVSACT